MSIALSTIAEVVTPQFNAQTVALGIGVLFGLAFLSMVIAWWRTWDWKDEEAAQSLRGLALPSGTTRSVLALLVVGGFVLFAFIGRGIVGEGDQYNAVFGAWVTLTGSITGFYFGSRVGQNLDDSDDEMAQRAARTRVRAEADANADATKTKVDAEAKAIKAITEADTAAAQTKADAEAKAIKAIAAAHAAAAETIAEAEAKAIKTIAAADIVAAQRMADAGSNSATAPVSSEPETRSATDDVDEARSQDADPESR